MQSAIWRSRVRFSPSAEPTFFFFLSVALLPPSPCRSLLLSFLVRVCLPPFLPSCSPHHVAPLPRSRISHASLTSPSLPSPSSSFSLSLSLSILLLILTLQVTAKSVTSRRRPSVRSPSIQVLSTFGFPRFGSSSAAPFPHAPNNTRLPQSISPTSSRSCSSSPLLYGLACSFLPLVVGVVGGPPEPTTVSPPKCRGS